MEFWRLRGVAYMVGAVEFANNVRRNVQDTLKLTGEYHTQQFEKNFNGKTAIVTGGNAGIGLALSKALALRGADVILACRSVERGRAAAQDIEQAASRQQHAGLPVVDVWELNLADLASVRAFARRFCKEDRRLDLLVCNAGVMAPHERAETADGLEMQFQVNHLGHWLLAHTLLGHQRSRRRRQDWAAHHQGRHASVHQDASTTTSSSTAEDRADGTRVIFLSSTTHRAGSLDWGDLQLRKEGAYSGFKGYANSKLAALLAAREFQRRLDRNAGQQPGLAVAVHPGLVNTQLARDWVTGADMWGAAMQPVLAPVMRALAPWLLVPPARAVDTLLFAATAPAHQVAGRYIASGRTVQPAKQALDDDAAARLWDASCQLTGTTTHATLQ